MIKRIGLVGLFTGIAAVGLAYGSAFLPGGPPAWAPWSFVVGMSTAISAVFVVGACRNGRLGGLAWVFAFIFVVVCGGFGLLLTLPEAVASPTPLWLGLPPGAAILLYGIGLLPLFVVPIAYALTFERLTLSSDDIERVRRMGEERAALLAARRYEAARSVGAAAAAAAEPRAPVGSGPRLPTDEEPRS